MKKSHTLALVMMTGLVSTLSAQLLDYDFNQTGTNVTNAGSLSSPYNLTLRAQNGSAQDLHGADGSGVSGLAGDRAVDFGSIAVSMGGAGGLGNFISETNSDLSPLSAMTVTGWYRVADGTDLDGGQIIRNNGGNGGWSISFVSAERMQFAFGTGTETLNLRTSTGIYNSNGGDWVFFAVSWDGSDLLFYQSDISTSITAPASTVALSATMAEDTQSFSLGRSNSTSGAFDGLLDNIQVYDSALNQTAIEAIRVGAIPESSSTTLLITLGVIIVAPILLRKRTKKLHN
ncbi:LamG domain-containing protein [Rubellicoccus peritrichatus]|uniref:LamG domain-containing protein n=1 Tax=Rubellicoccus peritrichatus TaxID=3080537 RepID=A0AAQ3LBA6_9BACT|nr:LamG domain-containing protein [Puniceicoccus sp. CR14]WOO40318.1 LamG domain-containing protein [Puniceicoccus sp. CR14]